MSGHGVHVHGAHDHEHGFAHGIALAVVAAPPPATRCDLLRLNLDSLTQKVRALQDVQLSNALTGSGVNLRQFLGGKKDRVGSVDPRLASDRGPSGSCRPAGIPVNAPVAKVRRVCVDPAGTVVYLGEVTYRGDFTRLEMDLEP